MGLPDTADIKLHAYTLFCRQLLTHLPALNDATRAALHLTVQDCLSRFDQSLYQFLNEASPLILEQAVNEFRAVLQGRVALFRTQNPRAADVFDRVVQAAADAVSTWRYQEDLEALHQQGRELALHFYAGSPWPVTQARLNRQAQLVVESSDEKPPLAFREHYLPDEADQELTDVILVRFRFTCDFALYLSYPYLFMHEYVSHIFATDYNNQRFNDGWLLYSAEAFMRRRWNQNLEPALSREQVAAFGEHLYGQLEDVPRAAYRFARDFDAWLGDPERFQAMTWELAAFEPRAGESDFWPDQFINCLEQEFDHNRPRLRRKIQAARDLRALFEMLAPV